MVIRPMAAVQSLGEIGRSAACLGGKGGSAAFFDPGADSVSLGSAPRGAGLYSAGPMFKIIGTVELMSEEFGFTGE